MSGPGDRVLGSYRLVERIGRGGMGEVYRARHLRLGREAAVKVLPPALVGEADFLRRFEREAASVAALEHPHILPVWDYGEQDGAPYLVMPLLRGGTLRDVLERGALAPDDALAYLRQVADALDYAHGRGLVHRDVKPANLLLDGRGLYLADFGVARALEGADGLTRTGMIIGTPEYMAPEQARGRTDERSDLYALGVILYQMLSGQVPYGGASAVEVLMKHLREPPPLEPLRRVAPALPAGVEEVVGTALAKDPDERYQSGGAMTEALAEALARGRATGAATVVGPAPRIPPPGRQTPAPGWQQQAASAMPATQTPLPYNRTPPPADPVVGQPAAPVASSTAPADAAGGRRRDPLLLGLAGALALALLILGAGVTLLARQGAATPTATASAVAAASPTGAPAPTPIAAASPTAAPTAAPTPPPTVAPTVALAYPGGGKYSTLEPVARRGGRFAEQLFGDIITFNPMIASDDFSLMPIALLFNRLVQVNPDTGLPFPDLAEAVPTRANGGVSIDGLAYTFRLRRDVKWHDGRPFTARDVLYTYATLANRELGSTRTASLNERVEAVTAPNDFTVVFRLKRPVASFLVDDMYAIAPEHILRDVPVGQLRDHPFSTGDARATVGTGPFRFQEWLRNNQLTLAKNPNYFLGEPALDAYVFKILRGDNVEPLKAGEIDFSLITPDRYGEFAQQPNLAALTYDGYQFNFCAYQLDPAKSTLFADQRVRQALAYGLDREAIVREVFFNLATVAQGTMPVPSWAYAPDQLRVRYGHDPRRAEQLLDEAGWRRGPDGVRAKDGRKLAFTMWGGGAATRDLLASLQRQWAAIGVEATPRTERFDAFLQRATETRDFEMLVGGFSTGPDPDQTKLWATVSYQGGFNFGRYANPRADELLAQGLGEFDQERRRRIYLELQNVVMDDLPMLILNFGQTAVIVNKRVHNLKPNALNTYWNAHTWWVDDGR